MKHASLFVLVGLLMQACGGSNHPAEPPTNPTPMPFVQNAMVSLSPEGVYIDWTWPSSGDALRIDVERYTDDPNNGVMIHSETDTEVTGFQDVVTESDVYHYRLLTFSGNQLLNEVVVSLFKSSNQLHFAEAYDAARKVGVPTVMDVDGDGDIEVLCGENINGTIYRLDYTDIGLSSLFDNERISRDNRAADFDGDGDWDLFCNAYASVDDANSQLKMFWNDGTGFFSEDTAIADLEIGGFGETILAFDFDNDQDIDVFVPHYSYNDPRERSYLFRNDGGTFVDVGDLAGVALRNHPEELKVEGAQALDLNEDGWIDFYVASMLFLNRGDGTFVDVREVAGLPARFDEGCVFTDFNADGRIDFFTHHPGEGPLLYVQSGEAVVPGEDLTVPTFELLDVFPNTVGYNQNYGFNAEDLNYDGLPDIEVAAGPDGAAIHFVNRVDRYELHENIFTQEFAGLMTFSDFNGDGLFDIARRYGGWILIQDNLVNKPLPEEGFEPIIVRVLGENGISNQQGRIVRLKSLSNPDFIVTRAVEGGSGFLSQGQYDVLMTTPYSGEHEVEVVLEGGVRVTAVVERGDFVTVWSNGNVAITQGQQGPLLRPGQAH